MKLWKFEFNESQIGTLLCVLEHAFDGLNREHVGESFDALGRRIAKDRVDELIADIKDVIG